MSESDDTDELLLMPVQDHPIDILEDNIVPYYQIVDKLLTQVSKLKSRITSIENTSEISFGSVCNSIDTMLNIRSSDSSNTCRRCYSYESLPQNSEFRRGGLPQCFSTQSTPQKPRSKLMLKSFPYSPNFNEELHQFKRPLCRLGLPQNKIEDGSELSDHRILPQVEESNIIKEIDDFLSNVKPFTKPSAARSLEFDNVDDKYTERNCRALPDVQQILREMEVQEEKIKNMHDEETNKHSPTNFERNKTKNRVDWKKGIETMSVTSTDSSLTDKSTVLNQPTTKRNENGVDSNREKKVHIDEGRNRSNYSLLNGDTNGNRNEALGTKQGNLDDYGSAGNVAKKSSSSPHFDVQSNAYDALFMHKKLLNESSAPEYSSCYETSKRITKPMSDPHLGSVSLVNLWGVGNNEPEKNNDKCIQKLQEEKMRRTHCEELIQQLQNKILEQQEKLAVAIQVDEAKDNAIIRFHDAWEKVTMKFKQVMKEKIDLEKDVTKLASRSKEIAEEYEERIEFHRKETNQALMMAQEHQSRLEVAEKKCRELSAENETFKSSSQELEKRLRGEEDKNKQLSEILANKEIELTESKNILMHAKKEVAQCQAAVEICQKDFTTIKAEYDLIQEEIKAERLSVSQLHEQNKKLHDELETQKKNEKIMLENLKEAQGKMDSNKKELRNFYQGQVELLVQTKLKEFQKQLDEAEQKMKEEMSRKELEIAKSAAKHIQQINDKYSLEINLIEQKHQEEMQLNQVKSAQLEQRLHELQAKLDRQQDKRADLVKQLQKVMEAQWNEALRIINNGKSPIPQDDSCSTIDQLQSLHSKSYQNMEALLNQEFEEKMRNQNHGYRRNEVGQQNGHPERRNHQKRGDNTLRQISRGKHAKPSDESDLQRYINVLLNKQPGNPLEKSNDRNFSSENPTNDRSWQQREFPQCPNDNFQDEPHRDENRKTPWK